MACDAILTMLHRGLVQSQQSLLRLETRPARSEKGRGEKWWWNLQQSTAEQDLQLKWLERSWKSWKASRISISKFPDFPLHFPLPLSPYFPQFFSDFSPFGTRQLVEDQALRLQLFHCCVRFGTSLGRLAELQTPNRDEKRKKKHRGNKGNSLRN